MKGGELFFLNVVVDKSDIRPGAKTASLRHALMEVALAKLNKTAIDEYDIVGIQWEASTYDSSAYADLRPYARVEVILRKRA